jgi:serine/threonine protein kinase
MGGFTGPVAQFYAGCVISAFNYIHGKGIAYRDLKPEVWLSRVGVAPRLTQRVR